MKDILPFEKSFWVIPSKLLMGEVPTDINSEKTHQKLNALAKCGIKTVINLMEKDEANNQGELFTDYFSFLNEMNLNTHRVPIRDISIPSYNQMTEVLSIIDDSIKNNRPTYVHCWGGVGRTGTVLGCYLLKHQMANSQNVFDVISYLRRTIPNAHISSPETPEQRQFVLNYRFQ